MDLPSQGDHIRRMHLTITVSHDEVEGVWFVQSSDLPGLNAEAATLDELVEVITDLAPDLIGNIPGFEMEGPTIPLIVQHVVQAGRAQAA